MYDDCKIYSVTEDYSIALAFIPGTAGGSSRYELRVISDEDFSRGVSVGSVGRQGIPVSGQNQWCGCILRGLHL